MDVINNPEDMVDRYGVMVYRLALAQMGNSADAEDVFQEVFLRLIRSRCSFENDEHLKAWLIRVAVNCSRSLWRTVLRRREVTMKSQNFSNENAQTMDEHFEVYDEVMRLPPKYRVIIHLYYYEGMSIESISNVLKISYNATAKRLSRARKFLKQELTEGEYYENYSDGIPESR